MIESELAYNANGEKVALPDEAAGLSVKQMRGGPGAPSTVFGRNGFPLVVDVHATMEDLREALDESGKYRLDAVDGDGKRIPNVQPFYVQVTVEPRNSATQQATSVTLTSTDHVVRELAHASAELMRQHTALAKEHTDLAKTVATQQPELMKAAAEILRAADGAGLPRRNAVAFYDEPEEELDEEQQDDAPPPSFNLIAAMQEAKPLLGMLGFNVDRFLTACGVRVPTAPKTTVSPTRAPQVPAPRRTVPVTPAQEQDTSEVPDDEQLEADPEPFIAADPLAHILAIQAQLAPEEQAFVKRAMSQLAQSDLMEWRDRLARTTVEDAVAEIRAEIAKVKQSSEEKKS